MVSIDMKPNFKLQVFETAQKSKSMCICSQPIYVLGHTNSLLYYPTYLGSSVRLLIETWMHGVKRYSSLTSRTCISGSRDGLESVHGNVRVKSEKIFIFRRTHAPARIMSFSFDIFKKKPADPKRHFTNPKSRL
jgi:hypothetical protein